MYEYIIKVACIPDKQNDWIEVKINLDEYYLYDIDYAGYGNWHIVGVRCDNGCLEPIPLTYRGISTGVLAEFIAHIRTRRGPNPFYKDRIRGFWNGYGSEGFYESLGGLLNLLKKNMNKKRSEYNGRQKQDTDRKGI